MMRTGKKLLPVAVMAHNEEKVIEQAIISVVDQEVPDDYFAKALIVANGCSDGTVDTVMKMQKKHSGKIELISMSEKGKTKAIRRAISHLERLSKNGTEIPYVVFLDADCEFYDNHVLMKIVERFKEMPELSAVAADCIPDVISSPRSDIVAGIYRSMYEFASLLGGNTISGMCYGIQYDHLKQINFPSFQLAEDMYLCARLDGRFIKDRNIKIIFRAPDNLTRELGRRTRQAISTKRYHSYYSFLRQRCGTVKLFDRSLGDSYRWGRNSHQSIYKTWLRMQGMKSRLNIAAYAVIRLVAAVKAAIILKRQENREEFDYWRTVR